MSSLSEPERRDFWEICEDRYQVRSLDAMCVVHQPVEDAVSQRGIALSVRANARPAVARLGS
jgi:hypothetical protein